MIADNTRTIRPARPKMAQSGPKNRPVLSLNCYNGVDPVDPFCRAIRSLL
jgi:hypothetical protein